MSTSSQLLCEWIFDSNSRNLLLFILLKLKYILKKFFKFLFFLIFCLIFQFFFIFKFFLFSNFLFIFQFFNFFFFLSLNLLEICLFKQNYPLGMKVLTRELPFPKEPVACLDIRSNLLMAW